MPASVMVSPAELADLHDALAVARLERDRAMGLVATPVPHEVARARLLEVARRDE